MRDQYDFSNSEPSPYLKKENKVSKSSQLQKMVEFLKANPKQKFNARQIADHIVGAFPEDYTDKRQNPRFADQASFMSQVVAEIGSQKAQILKKDRHVFWQDKPLQEFIGMTQINPLMKQGAGQSVRLWSFEVKKELTSSNARKSFFQAVSNSSWANEGYLVATSISDNNVEQELRMRSALHGIGVILLNPENPSESEMMLPAKARADVDWQSVNRILVENADFKDYIELVSTYYQTGRVRPRDWNR